LFKNQIATLPSLVQNFRIDKSYTHPKGFSFVAIDSDSKQILLAAPIHSKQIKALRKNDKNAFVLKYKCVGFQDILKSEINVDGETISSKSYSGAVLGGLLFGTTGAVVGGTGGKTRISKDVNRITLKLLLNDIKNPSWEVLFYDKITDTGLLKQATTSCQHWQDALTVAILNSSPK
jgi:hypothetical protein